MEKRLPPLQWLRSFEAAARHMSFTTAAQELAITQSAVSQQVKALEQFLDQPLFLRRARSLELTEAGREYLPTIREAFALLTQGTEAFFGRDSDNLVEIKANTAFSVFWLAPRLGDFLAAHPSIQVNLSTAMWDADFTGGYGSVEIRYGRGEWGQEKGEKLSGVTIYPVAAPALAEQLTSVEDLADQRLLHIHGTGYDWDQWLAEHGPAHLRGRPPAGHFGAGEVLSFNTYVLSFDLARRGFGVAIAHDLLVRDSLAEGTLCRPFEGTVAAREGYFLLGPRHGQMSAAAAAFCAWIRGAFDHSG